MLLGFYTCAYHFALCKCVSYMTQHTFHFMCFLFRAQKYGNTFVIFLLHEPMVFTCNPDSIQVSKTYFCGIWDCSDKIRIRCQKMYESYLLECDNAINLVKISFGSRNSWSLASFLNRGDTALLDGYLVKGNEFANIDFLWSIEKNPNFKYVGSEKVNSYWTKHWKICSWY